MGSFNPINFIINTMTTGAMQNLQNNLQGQSASNAQSAQNQGGVANFSTSNSTTSFTPLNYANQTAQTLSVANQNIISTVEVEQRANYIKDLLNLPRDFETLINQIQTTNPDMQALKDLSKLLQNGKIDLKALTSILTDNSREAVQKLMMTMAEVSKIGANVNQLKELMGLFAGAGAIKNSSQTVKNLLMLYLPYLPLSVRNELNLDFNIDIFDKIQGADPNEEGAQEIIKIMIQTANFGNVLATLELAMNNEIDVFISANESFPEGEVLNLFKKEIKKNSSSANVTVEKNKDPENSEKLKQNIQITSSNYVSPKLVLASHSLIKIIIEVDSKEFIINEEVEA